METPDWLDKQDEDEDDGYPISEYELNSMPNDFNIMTLVSFIEKDVVKIPGFQRHYIWDQGRASKLIESILIGLPIPQIFLYERDKNQFIVIDGQQRLMTIYYFVKQRFPKKEKRAELRKIFEKEGNIPENILSNDDFFVDFKLKLSTPDPTKENRFNGKKFKTLGDDENSFQLKTIRNIIVKSLKKQDDSVMYELFNRLNTGGVALSTQEVRMSLYHSKFMSMLVELNEAEEWRRLNGLKEVDMHMRDMEILLRVATTANNKPSYKAPMSAFINNFASEMKKAKEDTVAKFKTSFTQFFDNTNSYPDDFFRTNNRRFSLLLFEAIYYVSATKFLNGTSSTVKTVSLADAQKLKADSEFITLSTGKTSNTTNFSKRLDRAQSLIG